MRLRLRGGPAVIQHRYRPHIYSCRQIGVLSAGNVEDSSAPIELGIETTPGGCARSGGRTKLRPKFRANREKSEKKDLLGSALPFNAQHLQVFGVF
jgi:hypothetical protein